MLHLSNPTCMNSEIESIGATEGISQYLTIADNISFSAVLYFNKLISGNLYKANSFSDINLKKLLEILDVTEGKLYEHYIDQWSDNSEPSEQAFIKEAITTDLSKLKKGSNRFEKAKMIYTLLLGQKTEVHNDEYDKVFSVIVNHFLAANLLESFDLDMLFLKLNKTLNSQSHLRSV